jgi:DNA repair protein RecN (Recombination protein N)
MLSKLSVKNYAIIDALEVVFTDHLNIITGETGAGKSILVGALGLVLGARADSSVLREADKKAVVEALFTGVNGQQVKALLERWDIDASDELIIRRELTANGKSRAFINDTPANLTQLHELSALLVDMHLQFDTLDLGRNEFQRFILDALCDHEPLLSEYRSVYAEYARLQQALTSLKANMEAGSRELDYHRFLLDELEEANWQDHEMEDLEEELRTLTHAEQIKATLSRICHELEESEQPVVQQLRSMLNQLHGLGNVHAGLPGLAERMQSAYLELQDISAELSDISERVNMDAERMEEVTRRIDIGARLLKKHGVRTSGELLEIRDDLRLKVGQVANAEEEFQALQKALESASGRATVLARRIRDARKAQAGPFADKVALLLARVGMPNARLSVELIDSSLYEGGSERIQFLFDANRSGRFEPLQRVASGGELSRLMLVVKSLVARSVSMPTLIFDEIDSGISGEAARQVGILMKELSAGHQVISITHQPQIAARADTHHYVYKDEVDGAIVTNIRPLSGDERIRAIAGMLGGANPSALVLENAREMIEDGKMPGDTPRIKGKR